MKVGMDRKTDGQSEREREREKFIFEPVIPLCESERNFGRH